MEAMYRPKLHFTPKNNWMNDPNGLVYDEAAKEYHLFFQYCDSLIEDQSQKYWGHAVSRDLISWTEISPAISPDAMGGIWSGSAVIDAQNTSGFFDDSTPPGSRMVAFFTYAGGDLTYGFQKQAVAYSKDHGRTWVKYEENPVIKGKDGDTILYDNRDPKVFWYPDAREENGGIWVMIIAGLWARLFTSKNLRDWTFQGDVMYGDGVNHLESECPDLFPLTLDGDSRQIKWVYTGGGRFYVIGQLVRDEAGRFAFRAETEKIEPVVGCDDMYAAQTFYNDPKNRRIGIYWMIDKTADRLSSYGKTWDGYQSIPLEYRLISGPEGPRLRLYPAEEVALQRKEVTLYSAANMRIDEGISSILQGISGKILDIEGIVDVRGCDSFALLLRVSGEQRISIRYVKSEERLYLDRTKAGRVMSGIYSMALRPSADEKIHLRILLDTSVIDVFANRGEAMFNAIVFPENMSDEIQIHVGSGSCVIDALAIYEF